jgi:hypothetical protein
MWTLWGHQALHVRDGVTGSRFLKGSNGANEGLLPSVPHDRSLLRRVGVGGDRRASSGREVVSKQCGFTAV